MNDQEHREEGLGPRHVSEHLANERTFLAWVRTGIAIIGLGFVMAKFSVWLRQFMATVVPGSPQPTVGASLPAGITLILCGAVVVLAAYRRYREVERAIDADRYVPARGLLILISLVVAIVSLGVVAYLIETT